MPDLVETVGAKLVLLGQKEYISGLADARKTLETLGEQTKATAVQSEAMTEASVAQQAAQRELKEAVDAAVTAQREYSAALKAAAEAGTEEAAESEAAAAAKQREAQIRLDAATAAREAALTEVRSSQESAAAATDSAAAVEAAEAKKSAAAEAGSGALRTAAFGVIAIAGTVAAVGVKMAADFQSDTERLVTSAGESQANLDMVRQGILGMAGEVGYSSDQLAAAMYKIESGGQHGAAGLEVLKAAAQGAKTENADLTTVSDALTSVMQDYHLSAEQAADANSKLVAATASGKMTFEELSGSLSSILPVASAAHVSLDDILGDLASMTVHGMSADQAAQNLADTVRHMAAPTQMQSKELAALGINAQQLSTDLGTKGLSGTIQEVAQAIQERMGPGTSKVVLDLTTALHGLPAAVQDLGRQVLEGTISLKDFTAQTKGLDPIAAQQAKSFATLAGSFYQVGSQQVTGQAAMQSYTDAMRKAMGDATGLNTALMLTGENSQTTSSAIAAVTAATADAQGNVKGWDEIQGTFNQKLSQAKDGLGALAISIGTYLLPPLTTLVGWIATATTWLSQHQAVAMTLAGVIGVVLVGAIALGVTWLWSTVAALVAVEVAGAPLILVILAVVAAVALLAFGAYEVITHWSAISDFFVGLWNTVRGAFTTAWNWIVTQTQNAWNAVVGVFNTVKTAIMNFLQPVVDAFKSHWDEIKEVTNVLVGFLSAAFYPVWMAIKIVWGLIVGVLEGAWGIITILFKTAIDIIGGVLDVGWAIIVGAVRFTWGVIVAVLQGAWDFIKMIFNVARDIIVGVFVVFLDILTGNWSRAWDDIKDFAGRIWNDITSGISEWATNLWHNVVNIWNNLWQDTKNVFSSLWQDMKNIFRDGGNIVIHIIDGFLDVVNKVANAVGFDINLHIDDIPQFAAGGTLPVQMLAAGGPLFGGVGGGFKTRGPRAIVGEGDPRHPEYVIPTDPSYRGRALGLLAALMGDLGVGGTQMLAGGGILGDIWGGITSAASSVADGFNAAVDWVGNVARDGIEKTIENVWPPLDVPENSIAGFVPATLNSWRTKALDWIKDQYDQAQAAKAATNMGGTPVAAVGGNVDIVRATAAQFGWGDGAEWNALNAVIMRESGYRNTAQNPTSTAYGMFQFLDSTWGAYGGSKTSDPSLQALYGLRYIASRYGDPLAALAHEQSAGWYARGGVIGLPARADGGDVASGSPYLVGEAGPELFIPDSSGTVVSNDDTARFFGGGGDGPAAGALAFGAHVTVEAGAVVIYEAHDPQACYEATKQGIADAIARR